MDEIQRLQRVLAEAKALLLAYDVHFLPDGSVSFNLDVQECFALWGDMWCAVQAAGSIAQADDKDSHTSSNQRPETVTRDDGPSAHRQASGGDTPPAALRCHVCNCSLDDQVGISVALCADHIPEVQHGR